MRFQDYKPEKERWITFVESDFYPDYLDAAVKRYRPICEHFGNLLKVSSSSQELFKLINKEKGKERIQLMRIFRKCVSPDTSVEMLKVKSKAEVILREFANRFRLVGEVRKCFDPTDRALVAILREYEERGEKGYEVSSRFFKWFNQRFSILGFTIEGPERAGKDIYLNEVFDDYPRHRPVDFLIRYQGLRTSVPVVVGFIRYDSDRGGAQENNRTGGYRGAVIEIFEYLDRKELRLKLLFVNEGPGLLLGSMWDDYSSLEDIGAGRAMVATLKMLESRLTEEWMLGRKESREQKRT